MRPHLEPYQEIMWGYPEPSTASPLPPEVRAGRFRLRVIETPGHCAGHVVFFEPDQGWCFSGDIFARVNPKTIRPEESIPRTIASLRLLAALEVERLTLFTSIGKVVEDARGPLLQCVDYLDDLAARAKKLHQQGRGVDDIVREIFGAEHAFAEATGGHYTSAHLVRSALELP
jgi:glyoxylase-like metal-dependent hydrolase (beta-lactamase superfamily II)